MSSAFGAISATALGVPNSRLLCFHYGTLRPVIGIRSRGALRIVYRDDAPPMLYKKSDSAVPVGYMVDLCRAVAEGIGKQTGNAALRVDYVSATSADRFDAITGGQKLAHVANGRK